jgi:ADP-heptose:LPS heptosyltransferase
MLGCPHRGLELEFPLFARDRAEGAALLTPHPTAGACNTPGGGEGSLSPLARQGEGPLAAEGRSARRPLIGIHAGAHAPARRWPAERFAVVADHLAQRFGAQIVLTGGPGEEEIAQAVAQRMAAPALCVAGQTSLGGLAALIDRLDLFIANDTGPAHLADALGTPSVTIFGPADHRRWAPLDQRRHPIVRRPVPCSPCRYAVCPIDHRCLHWIQPDAVIEAAETLLVQGVQVTGDQSPQAIATVPRSFCRLM